MTCEFVKLPGGGSAIICGRKSKTQKCACGKPATRLCDHPSIKRSGTCDRPLCDTCAVRIGPDTDYCPDHYASAKAPQIEQQLRLEGI